MIAHASKFLKASKIVGVCLLLAGLPACAIPAGDSISRPPVPPVLPAAPPAGNSLTRVEPNAILDDPEEEKVEWEDYVDAANPREAWQKCRELAKDYTEEGGTDVEVKRVRESGRGRYRCIFEG